MTAHADSTLHATSERSESRIRYKHIFLRPPKHLAAIGEIRCCELDRRGEYVGLPGGKSIKASELLKAGRFGEWTVREI